LAEMGIDKQSY